MSYRIYKRGLLCSVNLHKFLAIRYFLGQKFAKLCGRANNKGPVEFCKLGLKFWIFGYLHERLLDLCHYLWRRPSGRLHTLPVEFVEAWKIKRFCYGGDVR